MATYDPEGQAKKAKKAAYELQLKKMLPKRGFDQLGREIDPRSGKLLEAEQEKWPTASDKDAPHKKLLKRPNKKYTDSPKGDFYAPSIEEQLDNLLTDPLEELYTLYEAEMNVMEKPPLQDEVPPHYESPHKGQFEHPVTKQRNEIDGLIAQGMDPVQAHTSVHGDIDTSNSTAKGALAGTLGRIQDDDLRRGVKIEYDKGSILAKDATLEKEIDAVTFDDLRTPMNQQVPDNEQVPATADAMQNEALEMMEDFDYNDDVAYLQTYGRA